jgi:hypothetical protein
MTKLLATIVALKATLIAASVALSRGDALPVVLISAILSLVQINANPRSTQTTEARPRGSGVTVGVGHDPITSKQVPGKGFR